MLRLPGQGDAVAIPLNGAPSTLIVKSDNPNLPGITENEVRCLLMTQAIGIELCKRRFFRYQSARQSASCAMIAASGEVTNFSVFIKRTSRRPMVCLRGGSMSAVPCAVSI